MIKKFLFMIAIPAIFASCAGDAGKSDSESTMVVEETEYIAPQINLGEFDAKAAEFVDKEVKVAGLVDHVCKHGGKKLFLVSDDGDVHVESDERFDESLIGSSVLVTGIVREFRVDEAYCLKMEEDNIKSHSKGETEDELYARKMEEIQWYRDSMATAETDHLSFYSIEYVSLIVEQAKEEAQEEEI
ncbi:MAG: OB-fold nucleic acid binding domain-containing protein [Bacteroidales bacterium]|nr:OB-fold nucleic acid binding domain-containing protein [Bacteroidales bacterium]MCF8403593.1 OB-fold nucleic acid binding domain-containing protein [Bacteroidales bacterium]